MALDKTALQTGIYDLFVSLNRDGETTEARDYRIASTLADLIENYVKSATLTTVIKGDVNGDSVTATGTGSLS